MFFAYLKHRYWRNWPLRLTTVLELAGIGGFVLTATDLVTRYITPIWPAYRSAAVYVIGSYTLTILLFAACLIIARDVRERVGRENNEVAQELTSLRRQLDTANLRLTMAEIQHRMAEVVRRHVLCKLNDVAMTSLQADTLLRQTLGGDVPRYLEARLGIGRVSVTVKRYAIIRDVTGEDRPVLTAVFRHLADRTFEEQRQHEMTIDRSVVFMAFRAANDRRMRRAIIRDTEELDTNPLAGHDVAERNRRYQQYAKDCGFRSVLAFPLRQPADAGALRLVPFLGFVSFDCAEPNAFDGLFTTDPHQGATNDGRQFIDTSELENFFALADNLATLTVLSEPNHGGQLPLTRE